MKVRIVKPNAKSHPLNFNNTSQTDRAVYDSVDTIEINISDLANSLWKAPVANENDIKNHIEYFIKSKTEAK